MQVPRCQVSGVFVKLVRSVSGWGKGRNFLRHGEIAGGHGWWIGVVAVGTMLLGACSQSLQGGSPPPVDRLALLTVGKSSSADIAVALGRPQGHGEVMMPATPQDLWVYEATAVEGVASHFQLLLVFVDPKTGVFNGYMWFRSGQLMGLTK